MPGASARRTSPVTNGHRNALGYERLLDAVLCLLVESGATALAEGFKPDHVAKRAGTCRASYYRTEGFPAGDVLNSESRLAVLEAAIDRALQQSAVDAYGKVVAYWGYRPRAPLDLEQFVVSVLALADGLILRYCADDRVDADLHSKLLAEVATALLEPVPSAPTPSCSRPEPGDHHTSGGWFDNLEKAVRPDRAGPPRALSVRRNGLAASRRTRGRPLGCPVTARCACGVRSRC